MARVVNIGEAKAQFSRLIAEVQSGGRVIIAKAGRPVAVLRAFDPHADAEPRTLGGWKGRVWMSDDFDDPLPDDLQRSFVGRER